MGNVLVLVDDDIDVLKLNARYLTKEGYEVHPFANGKAVLKKINILNPDCIVIDIMMPELDGITLCKELKKVTQAPVIFLTGKGSEEDKIHGLLSGGDDYVVKPYSLRELAARIHVHIRRKELIEDKDTQINFDPLVLDLVKRKVFYDENEISLSNREYELLQLLIAHPNEAVSFEDIGMNIFGVYTEQDRRSIMVNASRLRKKIEEISKTSDMIETVWSVGYRFVPPRRL